MLTGVNSDWSWVEKYFKDKRSVTTDKSSDAAAEFRVAGNKHFHKKDFKTALQYYDQVVYLLFVTVTITANISIVSRTVPPITVTRAAYLSEEIS